MHRYFVKKNTDAKDIKRKKYIYFCSMKTKLRTTYIFENNSYLKSAMKKRRTKALLA